MAGVEDLGTVIDCDVLVVGGGLAGASAAIRARHHGAERVVLVEKGKVSKTGMSTFGAGVFVVRFPEDSAETAMREFVENGEFMNDQDWLQVFVDRNHEALLALDGYGVKFNRLADGSYERKLGRGLKPDGVLRNVMFSQTQMMEAMRRALRRARVQLVETVTVTDLLLGEGQAAGAIGFGGRSGEWFVFRAGAVINAAGSNAYKGTFIGHRNVTGDAWAMMFRRGVEFISLEFATANTSSKMIDVAGLNMFVGLGGRFVNGQGEPFVERYDPVYGSRATLPRLTSAMAMEVKEGRGPIYLDMRHFSDADVALLRHVVPIPMRVLDEAGLNLQRDLIEWMPAMIGYGSGRGGGALIDTRCTTNLPGLYAIGDASWASFQGVGAVGGPNFPYCYISGDIAAANAVAFLADNPRVAPDLADAERCQREALVPATRTQGMQADDVLHRLQEVIFPYQTWLIRREDRLREALARVLYLRDVEVPRLYARDPHELRMAGEVRNMVTVAEMQLTSALSREESRGANLREDYPETDNLDWLKWVVSQKAGDGIAVRTVDIPIERYPIQPRRERFLHPVFEGARRYREVAI